MWKQTIILKTIIVVIVVTVIFIGLKKKMKPSSQDVSHKDKIKELMHNIAVIGCGYWAEVVIKNIKKNNLIYWAIGIT